MNSLTDKEINRASDGIDKALSTATRSNRGEVAFRILSVVRNLNDHIAFKIWKDVRPDQKMDINKVASKFGNVRPYQFVARFDHFLRASVSHFTPSEEGAERLMIKYYRYLLQLKKAVYDRYGMIILRNVDMFLEDLDEQTKDYYQKVATEIEKRLRTPPPKNFDNYYIDKIKPFFVNQEIYYEVALEPADEKPNKFNRITAFTKYDISTNYCVALSFSDATISVFNTDFPIKIITEWHVSIRPCELNNFAELLNVECSVTSTQMVLAKIVVLFLFGIVFCVASTIATILCGFGTLEVYGTGYKLFLAVETGIFITAGTLPLIVLVVFFSKTYVFSILLCVFYSVLNMSATALFDTLPKTMLWLLPTPLTTFWSAGDMAAHGIKMDLEQMTGLIPSTFQVVFILGIMALVSFLLIDRLYKQRGE